jgi:hypothetical protein
MVGSSWLPVAYTRARRVRTVPSGTACPRRCSTVPSARSPVWQTTSASRALTAVPASPPHIPEARGSPRSRRPRRRPPATGRVPRCRRPRAVDQERREGGEEHGEPGGARDRDATRPAPPDRSGRLPPGSSFTTRCRRFAGCHRRAPESARSWWVQRGTLPGASANGRYGPGAAAGGADS